MTKSHSNPGMRERSLSTAMPILKRLRIADLLDVVGTRLFCLVSDFKL